MVNWNVSQSPTIEPGCTANEWYDTKGCFTGCLVAAGSDGQSGTGQLTVFYTSVSRLPLHYTLPYIPQTETLAVAQSLDGGLSWRKTAKNPILSGPPAELDVTGWRDPFVATWPSMAKLLGHNKSQLYGMISGGIKDCSPAVFLYKVNPSNLIEWKFLNTLAPVGLNHSLSRWSGDMGINWECACFMTLQNEQKNASRDFIIVGCEGSQADTNHRENLPSIKPPQEPAKPPRSATSLQWMCGALQTTNTALSDIGTQSKLPKMSYQFGGRFDHGVLYAATTFRDPLSNKQIVWGWITEEDLPQRLVDSQGWSGMISLPREVSLLTLTDVTGTSRSRLQDITSIQVEREEARNRVQETFRVHTLGIAPAQCLQNLRNNARLVRPVHRSQHLTLEGDTFMDIRTHRFEMLSTFSLSVTCRRIGLSVLHGVGIQPSQQNGIPPLLSSGAATTTISFLPGKETVRIDRSITDTTHIIDGEGINTAPEFAPFTLFTFASCRKDGGGSDTEMEDLKLHVFFDQSVLEVFVNSRCVITTRVYPPSDKCWGVRFFAEEEGEVEGNQDDSECHQREKDSSSRSRLLHALAWDGLRADLRVISS
ncbi:hypothetical protein AYL99_10331 [Fonsecaea erecta]|uniref:Glycosyl hydrolase family 32 C-terminal domain-containing protein n=1 Tax=Fonsecaea erecta TaxID=1367422 RepID=A0A178Z6G1_9EURO|nr:hypothetical protein AYL99_10331 [Fonsecaea erecta]OAP55358.1 hypothetical protein AYL99_10331 [Fonsecaea erecta]